MGIPEAMSAILDLFKKRVIVRNWKDLDRVSAPLVKTLSCTVEVKRAVLDVEVVKERTLYEIAEGDLMHLMPVFQSPALMIVEPLNKRIVSKKFGIIAYKTGSHRCKLLKKHLNTSSNRDFVKKLPIRRRNRSRYAEAVKLLPGERLMGYYWPVSDINIADIRLDKKTSDAMLWYNKHSQGGKVRGLALVMSWSPKPGKRWIWC